MSNIYYKLYLADNYQYCDRIICYSLDQVQYELNKALGYTNYIVIEHNKELDMDNVIASGTFDINQRNNNQNNINVPKMAK